MHRRKKQQSMIRRQEVAVPADKEWYELAELAEEWHVTVERVRISVANLESAGVIQVRGRPGDRRYKQVNKASLDTLRRAVLGA
jgi:DNA-binding MarR family transcriptional regulator